MWETNSTSAGKVHLLRSVLTLRAAAQLEQWLLQLKRLVQAGDALAAIKMPGPQNDMARCYITRTRVSAAGAWAAHA
jgi:hypothetical protein